MAREVPFGMWLVAQAERQDAIGALARAAKQDPQFPLHGDAIDVSVRLNQREADWMMHEALESAELDWAAY